MPKRTKSVALALGIFMLMMPAGPWTQAVRAEAAPSVVVDGSMSTWGREIIVRDGIYYLPMRSFFEQQGYRVSWNSSASRIIVEKQGLHRLELTAGDPYIVLDGQSFRIDPPPVLVDGSVYIAMEGYSIPELMGYGIETNRYRGKLYLSTSIWDQIRTSLNTGSYRLEGVYGGVSGANRDAKLYLGDELVYEGQWSGGGMNGAGILYRNGKVIYKGGLSNNLPDGPGTFYDIGNERYEGLFKHGRPNGKGKLYTGDTLFYEGDWKEGRMSGNGKLYGAEGKALFEGTFDGGLRYGYGVLFDKDGKKVYEGNWVKDQRYGYGKSYSQDGKVLYAGNWLEDRENGKGQLRRFGKIKLYQLDGVTAVSEEEVEVAYVSDVEYRNGILFKQTESDLVYRGEFNEAGELHGEGEAGRIVGTVSSSAGVLNKWEPLYKGQFKNGLMTGSGTLYTSNGTKEYDGQLNGGVRDGNGLSFMANGQMQYYGPWVNGIRSGKGWVYSYGTPDSSVANTSFTLTEAEFSQGSQISSGNVYQVYTDAKNGVGKSKGTQYWTYDAAKKEDLTVFSSYGNKGRLVYEGDMQNGLRHGYGEEKLTNGTYKGNFAYNKWHGSGVLETVNDYVNVKYEGIFENGRKTGSGKLYVNKILVYEGQFLNDDRSGYGISYYDNGKKEYEGSFAYNNRHGIGTLYDYLGNVIYKGEFRDGLTLTQYKERYP